MAKAPKKKLIPGEACAGLERHGRVLPAGWRKELEDDLGHFLDSARKRLVALGAPLEPHLREARAKPPARRAAAQPVGAASKGART